MILYKITYHTSDWDNAIAYVIAGNMVSAKSKLIETIDPLNIYNLRIIEIDPLAGENSFPCSLTLIL